MLDAPFHIHHRHLHNKQEWYVVHPKPFVRTGIE